MTAWTSRLGGHPTAPENLWPEAYNLIPGARQKDTVENGLHNAVCQGSIDLRRAQDIIRSDWYRCYLDLQSGRECR